MADEDKGKDTLTEDKDKDKDGEGKDTDKPTDKKVDKSKPTADELKEELARKERLLDIANKEAAERRKKLEAYEKAEEERKKAEMTELEKAQKAAEDAEAKAAEAEKQRADALITAAVKVAAIQANLQNPDDATRLIDYSQIKVDDNGDVTGVDEAIGALVKDKSYLVKAADKPNIDATKAGKQKEKEPDEDRLKSDFRL